MARYLVTGGLGFIGSHVTSVLLEDQDAHVTVVDSLQGHVFTAEHLVGQLSAGKAGRLTVHVEAIADHQCDHRYDVIYHLASVVGPAAVLDFSGFITESIVRDSYVVMRMAQEQGARLVNVSTSEVYGGGNHGLCEEDAARVIKGRASARQEYAAGKLACEVSIANLCQAGLLNAVTVRPFNVAGVRQLGGGGFVLPRFVGQALLGLPLTVFGDGRQLRAFTDVRDVAEGIRLAEIAGESGTFYNVGNPENKTTIRGLAEMVLNVTNSASEVLFVDPKRLYGRMYEEAADKFPDASRLMRLGWRPRRSLEETVQAVSASLQELPSDVLKKVAGLDERKRPLAIS